MCQKVLIVRNVESKSGQVVPNVRATGQNNNNQVGNKALYI